MVELTIELSGEKLGWLGLVEENIHEKEIFRLHFYGILFADDDLSSVMIELPKGMKLRRGSRITRREYEQRRLVGSIPELPFWQQIHEGEDFIEVDFEAAVTSTSTNSISVILPDSYLKEDNKKPFNRKSVTNTFTFKTEHTYLSSLLSSMIQDHPVVEFYGPLTDMTKEGGRVEISLPVSVEVKTHEGGKVCMPSQSFSLAVVNDIPGWRDKAETLGSPGYLFAIFEAVVISATSDGEITVALPEHYR